MKKSFYEILEVSNSASQEAIEAMYQILQKRYSALEEKQYPDAANHLKFIQLAYEVISDPVKRAAYDQRIAKASSTLTEVPQTIQAEQPTLPSQRPAQSEPATKGADNKVSITPVDLIAQLKEANRNTGSSESLGERIVAIATKPLVVGIVGLMLFGSMAYSFMKPSRSTATSSPTSQPISVEAQRQADQLRQASQERPHAQRERDQKLAADSEVSRAEQIIKANIEATREWALPADRMAEQENFAAKALDALHCAHGSTPCNIYSLESHLKGLPIGWVEKALGQPEGHQRIGTEEFSYWTVRVQEDNRTRTYRLQLQYTAPSGDCPRSIAGGQVACKFNFYG